jgi:hypothetical protein
MNRTVKIFLIVFILVFFVGGGFLVYLAYQEQKTAGGLGNIFPFGDDTESPTSSRNDDVIIDGETPDDTDVVLRKFFQITTNPVAGFTVFEGNEGTVVRYMERGTGNIFDYNTERDSQTQVSNKTIEFAYKTVWGENGEEFIVTSLTPTGEVKNTYYSFDAPGNETFFFEKNLAQGDNSEDVRSLQKALNKDPETLIGTTGIGSPGNESTLYGKKTADAVKKFQEKYKTDIGTTTPGAFDDPTRKKLNDLLNPLPSSIQGTELFERELLGNIIKITVSPDKKEIFYIELSGGGVSGIRSRFDGSNKKEIFSSEITEWDIEWTTPSKIFFTTKPSQNIPGSAYELDLKGNQFRKLFGRIPGLVAKENNDGSFVVYSKKSEQGNGFSVYVYDVSKGTHTVTNIATIPDKCVWDIAIKGVLYCGVPQTIPVGKYPDDWYKGRVSLSDTITSFSFDTLTQDLVINPISETLTTKIDILEMKQGGSNLLFIQNKEDLSLWGIRMGDLAGASSN